MKKEMIKKVMVYDQQAGETAGAAFCECMSKIQGLLGDGAEYIRLSCGSRNPMAAAAALEKAVAEMAPDLVMVPATAMGEELAPALGIRLNTGVAAHCCDILVNEEGRMAYMVPAFGGKVIGEILIPDSRPAICSVKPGVFTAAELTAFETVELEASDEAEGLSLLEVAEYEQQKNPIDKAELIWCGGFGIGSSEGWEKLEKLVEATGGAAGCTRPVVDMGWGPDEQSMIGTSGKTVRPKLYVGFGISGAAHHLCGIQDSGSIVSINSDESAEGLAASDYKAVADAGAVMDSLLEKLK